MKAIMPTALKAEQLFLDGSAARGQRRADAGPPTAEQLLAEGGDARISLDPESAANKYGCRPYPDPDLAAFGSSTASVISEPGMAAAEELRHRLLRAAGKEPPAVTYARELHRVRDELLSLCGISDLAGVEVAFAASGTDVHLFAGQLAGGGRSAPGLAVMIDAAETGSCVPAALAGRHFSDRAASGDAVDEGAAIVDAAAIEVANVALRGDDGAPRRPASIDADVEALVAQAAARGRRVLLTLVDVSKTGLIAPSLACALELRQRFPDRVDVLVDACQFRIAPSTLRAYLQQGFMVAVTGSKFVTGPSFSGALFIPLTLARRFRAAPLPRALRAYSVRADWPRDWAAAAVLDDAPNFGLLLRWQAALAELRAFRAVPEDDVIDFLQNFSRLIQDRLRRDPFFESLSAPPLDRRALDAPRSWDHVQTIFPFVIYRAQTGKGRAPLSREETMRVYRLLQTDLAEHPDFASAGLSDAAVSRRCQLGQPVACGKRGGIEVSALRLCASTRLVVEATAQRGRRSCVVIEKALTALDKIALLV
jgi:hypothetical protein